MTETRSYDPYPSVSVPDQLSIGGRRPEAGGPRPGGTDRGEADRPRRGQYRPRLGMASARTRLRHVLASALPWLGLDVV